jgi:uncharacterized membrane protein
MARSIENYIPQDIAKHFKAQAVRVWMIGLAVVVVWTALILFAPLSASYGAESVSRPIYTFFSYICHQRPERSFFVLEHQFGVCSRCFGVYFGLVLGFIIYPLWRRIDEIDPLARFWLILSLVPIGIDWSLTAFGIWENSHLSRFITGLILGVACATFIVPAIVEITRNLTLRRHTKKAA